MTIRTVTLAVVLLTAAWSAADDAGLHLESAKPFSNWPWRKTDGAGFQWDVTSNGYVSSGTNNAYGIAMQLRLNGTSFSYGGSGRIGPDGHEIEVGPARIGTINVRRRIYVDPANGYCRWIDLFENSGKDTQDLSIDYSISLGGVIRGARTSSGKSSPQADDWAVATTTGQGSRPAIFHALATPSARIRPTIRFSTQSNVVSCRFRVRVAAGGSFALCLFQAQRPYDQAVAMLKNFHPASEMRKVPPELRRKIVNMGPTLTTLGAFAVPRDENEDTVVMVNNDELLGTILNESYTLQTLLGPITLPAEKVLGLQWPHASEPQVRVGMVDGQVLTGMLTSGNVRLRLPDGNTMDIEPRRARTVAYRLSEDRPAAADPQPPLIILRNGQRLTVKVDAMDLTFETEYGPITPTPDALQAVYLDTPDGGLHRAVFRNGSILSGLLGAERLDVVTKLAAAADLPRADLSAIVLAEAPPSPTLPARLVLRNDDELRGHLAQKTLTVLTTSGKVTVATETIAKAVFNVEAYGRVRMDLHNGTKITGVLQDRTLTFQIDPGPSLTVFAGHAELFQQQPPEDSADTADASPDR